MIWCIEDDPGIREIEVYALNSTGMNAVGFGSAEEFREALKTETPELILLDVMLPGEDGVTILKQLRADERYRHIPVIMATARSSEFDKVQSLDLGADDYITKPFGMMEMVSRVKAVLRRAQPKQGKALLRLGGLTLDEEQHTVTIDGQRTALTFKEYELLRLFLSHPGMAFSRDQLLQAVWNTDYAEETRTVDMHIRTLRQKLGDYGRHIETIRGVGYRLEEKDDR
ncbi:MAG: response regulator transcription factor [Firmicutes bacterium]|nr:response regulator transcription factor [Bacillota bacterium]